MILTTKVVTAKAGTKSIKSTVPEGIVEYLQLKDKDELEWNMDMQNNERVAIVKKVTKDKDSIELAGFSLNRNGKKEIMINDT
jgi:putative heme iron utilization protein